MRTRVEIELDIPEANSIFDYEAIWAAIEDRSGWSSVSIVDVELEERHKAAAVSGNTQEEQAE